MSKKTKIIIIISIIIICIIISILFFIKNNNLNKINNEPSYADHYKVRLFTDDALNAITTVKAYSTINEESNKIYSLSDINNLIEKKLVKSPYGFDNNTSSCIKNDNNTFYICLIDEGGNGFSFNSFDEVNEESFNEGTLKNVNCNCK